jgi:hypothetical protein
MRSDRPGLRLAVVLVLCSGEVGADLVGFGGSEVGVEGEGLLPVVSSLAGCVGRLVGSGEAVVGASLLVFPADLGCQSPAWTRTRNRRLIAKLEALGHTVTLDSAAA